MAWALRDGTESDLGELFALDLICFEPAFRFDLRAMRRYAQRSGAIVRVAEQGSELAGFLIVHLERSRRGTAAYIVTLDVAPGLRRQGLAGALVADAEKKAAEGGAQTMLLHVFAGNAAAIGFYRSAGYQLAGEEKGFYGDGLDALVYAKGLP